MGFRVHALALAGKSLRTVEVVLWKVAWPLKWRQKVEMTYNQANGN